MDPWMLLGVVAVSGVIIWELCKNSAPKKAVLAQAAEPEGGTKPYSLPPIIQNEDVTTSVQDPHNVTSNMKHLKPLKTETGPYGVPRKIYQGAGGARISNVYGNNYEKM